MEGLPCDRSPPLRVRFLFPESRAEPLLEGNHPVKVRETCLKVLSEEPGNSRARSPGADGKEVVLTPDNRGDEDITGFSCRVVEEDSLLPADLPDTVIEVLIRSGGNSKEYSVKQVGKFTVIEGREVKGDTLPSQSGEER